MLKIEKDSQTDSSGISAAVCELMQAGMGHSNVFSDDDKCFNGKNIFDYQLKAVWQSQKLWSSKGLKFATFLETNQNHNRKYISVKNIDSVLATYLNKITKLDDVLTVVLSDHGNKWSDYVTYQYPEGSIDQWNPFLFVILPNKEKLYFTPEELEALKSNQEKLVTMIDLHYLLSKFSIQADEETAGKNYIT